jgi:hypothetical protein
MILLDFLKQARRNISQELDRSNGPSCCRAMWIGTRQRQATRMGSNRLPAKNGWATRFGPAHCPDAWKSTTTFAGHELPSCRMGRAPTACWHLGRLKKKIMGEKADGDYRYRSGYFQLGRRSIARWPSSHHPPAPRVSASGVRHFPVTSRLPLTARF